MSKLAATLSIVIALFVGGLVTHLSTRTGGPTNDGNPIGFRLDTTHSTVTLTGSMTSTSALKSCSTNNACVVRIYLHTPKIGTQYQSPDPCPTPDSCFQFEAPASTSAPKPANVSSQDWDNTPHPSAAYGSEPVQAAGTIYISDH